MIQIKFAYINNSSVTVCDCYEKKKKHKAVGWTDAKSNLQLSVTFAKFERKITKFCKVHKYCKWNFIKIQNLC